MGVKIEKLFKKARVAQLVEHHVANVIVAGSSPVSRSFFILKPGDVPKWLRERSAKPLCGGSNPPVASNKCQVEMNPILSIF